MIKNASVLAVSTGNYSDLSLSGATSHWQAIDDPFSTPDGNTSYIYCPATFLKRSNELYNYDTADVPNFSQITVINSVSIHFNINQSTDKGTAYPMLNINGSDYIDTQGYISVGSWSGYTKTWSANPLTYNAWTQSDLNGLQFGFKLNRIGLGNYTRVTQCYLIINYEYPQDLHDISFYVKDWYYKEPVEHVKIDGLDNSGVIVSYQYTNSAGYAMFASADADQISHFSFSKYKWEFNPSTIEFATHKDTSCNITLGPEVKWPNIASTYAFRIPLYQNDSHDQMPKGTNSFIIMPTGHRKKIASNGHFNEAIQHSSGNHVVYYKGKTHVVWRAMNGYAWGRTLYHNTNTWSTAYNLGINGITGHADWDSHFYPSLEVDHEGYLWLELEGHHSAGQLSKSANINDLSGGFVDTVAIPLYGTYPRLIHSDNGLYVTYRGITGNNSNWCMNIYWDEPQTGGST